MKMLIQPFPKSLSWKVFVYSKQNYQHIKDRLKTRGVAALSKIDMYNYFAPWYAGEFIIFNMYHELMNYDWINLFTEHLGQIRAASGNKFLLSD